MSVFRSGVPDKPTTVAMPERVLVMPERVSTHHLKIDPELFSEVVRGNKTAEIRRDDRDYQVGDLLVIRPFDRAQGQYIGTDSCMRRVTHKVNGGQYGIEAGYCLLSIK